ncbi:MAG: serine/threonine protein kinase [Planctomycetales bacterium]|nr:serine/threonine protein kinase [Planctomycetales bacterium]
MHTKPPESLLQTAVLACGLVTAEQLDYCLRVARHRQSQHGLATNSPVPDTLLSEILIEQAILTRYQANQLSDGKTKLNLGPYIITDFIGQGGMGQVFKAVHQVMGRECAVKVLPRERTTQESLSSFTREIRMQAVLDCPHLVRAFDAGHDGKVHFLVTEYVPGMDLRRLVKSNRGPLSTQRAAQIIRQAALGLDYAHQAGLVHRDVKPGNILVTPEGLAKVSDVGLAGFAEDLINDPRAGKIIGTPDYISPEQIRTPLEIKPTADIYSLGCTLYYTICGKVPFPGGDTQSKLRRHLEGAAPLRPRLFQADIPIDIENLIVDMMEKDPAKRISSAAVVAARLEPWAEEAYTDAEDESAGDWHAPLVIVSPDNAAVNSSVDSLGTDRQPPYAETLGSLPSTVASDSQTSSIDGSDSFSGGQLQSVEPPIAGAVSNEADPQRMSSTMLIALTVAIVVPPTLLLGAILGYLASR